MKVLLRTMISTMKISDETKKELARIGAEYTMKDGKERSLEEVVKLLVQEHKQKAKKGEISVKQ